MSKITKKQVKQEITYLKQLLKAAEVYADTNTDFSNLVNAQYCLNALAIKAKEVEQVIRQLEIQNSKAVA